MLTDDAIDANLTQKPGKPDQKSNQKTRTRMAIVVACRELIETGADVTMPEVARRALVSEATAYRYFPDIVTLINESLTDLWPSPGEALASIASVADPVARITAASEAFLRRTLSYQGSIRAMIAATITHPDLAARRPGLRFRWIDYALAPFAEALSPTHADALSRLKRELAVVVSPEALFTLMDLCGLSADDAITTTVRLAAALTALAFNTAA